MRRRPANFRALVALAAAAFLPAWPVFAGAADAGVGFVNIPVIMDKAPQAKIAREKLQREFSGRRKQLDDCRRDIEDLDRKLRREGRDMEKSRRDRMIARIKSRRRECGDLREEFEADFNRRRGEELNELQKQISGVIERIAEKRELKLIVGPPVIYVDEQRNLTEEVLDALARESR